MLESEIVDKYTIDSSGCHNWAGAKNADGYGMVKFRGRITGTHRAIWTIVKGVIPAGMCVLHKCDNPLCMNLSHLFLGTQKDNMLDAVKKGRHKHYRPLDSKVPDIRNEYGRISLKDAAKKFRVNITTIQQIWSNKIYRHLPLTVGFKKYKTSTIHDEFSDLKISRERKRQMRKKKTGKCIYGKCKSSIHESNKSYCLEHWVKRRENQRVRLGCRSRWNSRSYKAQKNPG